VNADATDNDMISRLHVISGLPRSGSTLLSALLRQNPRFRAGVSTPLASLCGLLHQKMGVGEYAVFFDEPRRLDILRGLFDAYYAESHGRLVFDTNRSWTGRVPLLTTLYPRCRVICCVREVGWILDSIERVRAKNPLQVSKMFSPQNEATVYTRAEALMNSQKGLVGAAWTTLREAWFAEEANRLIVVPYESLVRQPERTLCKLYEELDEPVFAHDFDNVSFDEPDYDAHLGMPGLHTVRSRVHYEERSPRVPPDLFSKYANTSFWTRPDLNTRGVVVL
jgi:sulfotransferase